MAERAFVDSNVLLRAMFEGMHQHRECMSILERLLEEDTELWLNHQVIREFCVQATHTDTFAREQAPRPHFERVLKTVVSFPQQFEIAVEDAQVRGEFLGIMRDFNVIGKQLHDANIVATMQVNDIDTLVTRNERHFRRFSRIRLLSPNQDFAL